MATTVPLVSQTEFKPSEISFGAGALSGTYNKIESHWPVEACREALKLGINTFDTSPFYGPSEFLLGDALHQIKDEFPRASYYISTKVGRYGYYTKDFDYSSKRSKESVQESMRRLHTDYIDIVFCHDVEFVEFEDVVGPGGALEALFELKAENKIRYVGCSGFPLPVLLKVAEHQYAKGQPLDIVLSYCHYALNNTQFADYAPRFRAAGVRYLLNASPLSMGLFREMGPPEWHPIHPDVKVAAQKCNALTKENNLSISEIASRFSFSGRSRFNLDTTVIGIGNREEAQKAAAALERVKAIENGTETLSAQEQQIEEQIHALLKPYKDMTWQSPTDKEKGLA
ncbi:NADP-dependent oxidoreductase domain-containing protein [Spinellus fusiger]|nr:NADP-dependent oxidoreductase domain-containing protein [Spinellus fusiger]